MKDLDKPENRSKTWKERHLNIKWEDRTLLYVNRLVAHFKAIEFHALKDKETGHWQVWWVLEDKGDVGRTTTKTFGLSLLSSINYIIANIIFPAVTKERRESDLLERFFSGLTRKIRDLTEEIPEVLSRKRYKNYFQSPEWESAAVKEIRRKKREKREKRKHNGIK